MRKLISAAVILLATPPALLATEKPRGIDLGSTTFTLGEARESVIQKCPVTSSLPLAADADKSVCWLNDMGDETFAVVSGPARHPDISGIITFERGYLAVISRNRDSVDVDTRTGQALQEFLDLLGSRIANGSATADVEYTKSDDPDVKGQSVFIRIGDSGVEFVLSTGLPGHKGLQLEVREVFVKPQKP
jgi:hypothetical protein